MNASQVLDAIADAAILTDVSGVVRAWNGAAERLLGWTAAEMVGRPLIERFPEAVRAEVEGHIRRLAGGLEWEGEFEDHRKDGSRIWIHSRVRAVLDETGKMIGMLGLSREIPHRKVRDLVKERDDRIADDILDAMDAHVAVLGADGRIRQVNRAWDRFAAENSGDGLGARPKAIGVDYLRLCRACLGEADRDAVAAAEGIEDVLQGRRSSFVLEYPCDSPTEPRWFAMHVTPLSLHRGGAVVAHHDITARKLSELQLARQNQQIQLALTAARMGVWSLDLKTRRMGWSAEVYQILGVTEFDGTLGGWNRIVHVDDREPFRARLNDAVAGRVSFGTEFRIVRQDGSIRWMAAFARVACDSDDEPIEIVGTIQDVTEEKRSRWALTGYNRILELIASGADMHQTLEEVVRFVEEQLPGSLCSVLLVEPETNSLRFGAGGSLPADYNRAVDGAPIGPKAGSCGTAAYRKQAVMVNDIAADPLWDDYRDFALPHGLRSCVSVPICSSGNVPGHQRGSVIGTFALYHRHTGCPDPQTFAVLAGAEHLARHAIQSGESGSVPPSDVPAESVRIVEAAHLAGVAIERAQAEKAIRETESRFQSVLNSSPEAVYLKDLSQQYLFVNRRMAELFRIPQPEWCGKRPRDLLPPRLADECEAIDRIVLDKLETVRDQRVCVLPDGSQSVLITTHFPLLQQDGRPYAVCGILTDITGLVSAQRESHRLWTYAPQPLCVAGFDGCFKQINPAWSRLLGWTEAQLRGRRRAEFVHPDDQAATESLLRQLAHSGTVHRFENRFRCADGSYRWFAWEAIPVPAEGTLYGFVRDVTEEKSLSEQFHQAQKMEAIGQLASGVAHDFNNLLTVINGFCQLLLLKTPETDPRRGQIAEVLGAGERAAELTAQLLAFSRKAIVEPRVLDINQVVESSTRMLRRLIGEDVQLVTDLSAVPPVRFDPGQLDQVFMNLAVNARDAMPVGGRLTISTAEIQLASPVPGDLPAGTYAEILVSDTGIGMSPEVRSRIFEPFFTTKGLGKGTGLGLATVYGILRQAGGAITVESEPGRGATFRILLPAERHAATDPKPAVDAAPPRGSETVLLVEDEDGVRDVAKAILELQGYTVIKAAGGAEALRLEAGFQGRIDLLVTDVVMPDLSGRVLAASLLARRPGIRVLYMSGYADDSVLRHGVETSKDHFIQKPFTPGALARRVREVLDIPEV